MVVGLIGLVTNGGVEGITGVSHKKPPIKLAMKGKKWAIKALYWVARLTGDRLAECARECLLLIR